MKRLVSIAVCFITIISIAITNINAKTTTVYYGFYGSETTVFKKKGNKLTVKVRSPIDYYKKNIADNQGIILLMNYDYEAMYLYAYNLMREQYEGVRYKARKLALNLIERLACR